MIADIKLEWKELNTDERAVFILAALWVILFGILFVIFVRSTLWLEEYIGNLGVLALSFGVWFGPIVISLLYADKGFERYRMKYGRDPIKSYVCPECGEVFGSWYSLDFNEKTQEHITPCCSSRMVIIINGRPKEQHEGDPYLSTIP